MQPKLLRCSCAGAIPHGGAHEHVWLFQPGECTHALCHSEQTAKLQKGLTSIICMCAFSGYQFQLPMMTSHPFPSHSHNQNACSQDKIFYFSPTFTVEKKKINLLLLILVEQPTENQFTQHCLQNQSASLRLSVLCTNLWMALRDIKWNAVWCCHGLQRQSCRDPVRLGFVNFFLFFGGVEYWNV